MDFLLKITDGPNKGAEIALVAGVDATIGSSDSCDIVLAGSGVPGVAGKFSVSGDSVSFIPEGGELETLEPFHVKELDGGVAFAVGPAEGAWQPLVRPEPPPAESAPPAAPEKPAGDAPAAPPPPQPDAAPDGSADSKTGGRGRRGLLIAAIAALFIVIAVLALLRFLPAGCSILEKGSGGGDGAAAETDGKNSALAALAEKYSLKMSDGPGGAVLSGNFKTRAERLSASGRIYEACPGALLDLSDDETLRAAAEETLSMVAPFKTVRVDSATNRVVSLSGSVRNAAALRKIVSALSEDVPHLEKTLCESIVFDPSAAAGANADGAQGAPAPAVRAASPRRSAQMRDLPVCGIVTVPHRCLVMRDGRRVFEGASVAGFEILEISCDSVVLSNSSGRVVWKP